uniref:UTP--glucose-1-phosphate uridylyltransferase n=1 Tax=Trepomonas sp. PC1 TaxID=1076344 RepID=A0A146KAN8_9EUKA|eukprot:JAP93902.1 UTP-glucose-1-phosphate uridylyltransferase [Trepomonas sp. PC1]
MQTYTQKLQEHLKKFGLDEIQTFNCIRLYNQYEQYIKENKKIDWSKVNALKDSDLKFYENLPEPTEEQIKHSLQKVAVLKLNGGLGTSMGCAGPKSLLEVREGLTFLDFSMRQLKYLNEKYRVNVPLILMNSFNTDKATQEHVNAHNPGIDVHHFNQFELPRMDAESHMPADLPPNQQFYPPGHGYVYECLRRSPIMQKLIEQRIEYVFISNADNLGAVLDVKIASFCITRQPGFLSEQTLKTLADVKGGVLMNYENSTRLLETAQVPADHMGDFCNINVFKYFNVNNLWMNLQELNKSGDLQLDLIVNPKTVDNKKIIQLEVAAGANIANFDSIGLVIPRNRFQPVKKSGDLLLLQSDCFEIQKDFRLKQIVERQPLVNVAFQVQEMLQMFKNIPSLKECTKFDVEGEVECQEGVKIVGEFHVPKGDKMVLAKGTYGK